MISTACSDCGKVFNLSDDKAGKRAKCSCGSVFTIPAPSSAPIPHPVTTPITSSPVPKASPSESKAPAIQQVNPEPGKNAKVQATFNRLKPLLEKRSVRLILATAACIVIVGSVGFYKLASDRAALQAEILERSEANYRQSMAGADRIAKQAQADVVEASQLRSRVNDSRDDAATEAPATPRKTRSTAIDDDPYIALLLDRHPQLRNSFLRGTTSTDGQIEMLMSQGKITSSDIRYIQTFARSIEGLSR